MPRPSSDDPPATPAEPTAPGGAKGRATPSRRQAEAQRLARARPPTDRKAERKRRREAVNSRRAQVRDAMETGDERYYMSRDRGPVRRFVRNWTDARRTAAEFFLPAILLVFVLSLVPSPNVRALSSLLMIVVMLLMVSDLVFYGFRLKKQIRTRFPDDAARGHLFYGITRAMQLRRFRLPKPQVKPGASV